MEVDFRGLNTPSKNLLGKQYSVKIGKEEIFKLS